MLPSAPHAPLCRMLPCSPLIAPQVAAGTDVITLEMHVPRFRFRAGQYLYLNCPAISASEWHPFTITSAPEAPPTWTHDHD